ncbi:MAG: hypothetical protein ACRBCS_00305 [Cellvibrionaceae bacterium]
MRVYRDQKDAFGGRYPGSEDTIKGGFEPSKNSIILVASSLVGA